MFLESVLEKLKPHGPITARAMFGGYGIYYKKVMIGLVAQDCLYFKVDHQNQADYEAYKSSPFVYESKNRQVVISYWAVPKKILENSRELPKWMEKSWEAAINKKTPLKNKRGMKTHRSSLNVD